MRNGPTLPMVERYLPADSINEIAPAKGEGGCIIGQNGTGKSFLAKRLLPRTGRLAIIDPKREFDDETCAIFSTPGTIRLLKPNRFIYRPTERFLYDVAAYDMVYEHVYRQGNTFLFTDDLMGVMRDNYAPHSLKLCNSLGRSKGITRLSIIQRPVSVPKVVMTEAHRFYVFALTMHDDRKVVESFIGHYPESLENQYVFAYKNRKEPRTPARLMRLEG